MIRQTRPGELVDILRTDFQHRNEPNFAWKSAVSSTSVIPGLVASWPMSVVRLDSATDRVRDVAGGGYHLTDTNGVLFGSDNLAPYAYFLGTNEYLIRTAGAASWASIIGTESHIRATAQGLALGGWFYFTDVTQHSAMIAKWDTTAPNQRGYLLWLNGVTSQLEFRVSTDGTLVGSTIVINVGAITVSTWYHVMGIFDNDANTISIVVNGVSTSAAFAGTIFDCTADVTLGAAEAGTAYFMEGIESLCWLSQMGIPSWIQFSLWHQQRAMFGV